MMEKTKRVLSLVLGIILFCGLFVVFAGCTYEETTKNLYRQVEELQNQLNCQQEKIDELEKNKDSLADIISELDKERDDLAKLVDDLKKESKEQRYRVIKQAYVNFFLKDEYPDITADDAIILYYVGEFSNCEVAMLEARHQAFFDAIYKVTISGVQFTYPSSNVLYVCHDAQFYSLQEAFGLRLISQQDLEDIGAKYAELRRSPPEFI